MLYTNEHGIGNGAIIVCLCEHSTLCRTMEHPHYSAVAVIQALIASFSNCILLHKPCHAVPLCIHYKNVN